MRNKRRNTYVVNRTNSNRTSHETNVPNSSAQFDSAYNDVSSTATISSSITNRPADGSMKSLDGIDIP